MPPKKVSTKNSSSKKSPTKKKQPPLRSSVSEEIQRDPSVYRVFGKDQRPITKRYGPIFRRLTGIPLLTVSVEVPGIADRKEFITLTKNLAEQEARKKWDRAYSDRPKNKGGRPKEDEQSRIFFFEVLKETGGKLPKYQRHKSYWVDEVNKKWLKQTGRQRDPRAIGRAIQPIIEKLPPAYKPSREQTMGIRDPFEFTEEMFQKNLDAMIGHIHIPRIKKEVPFIDLWDLGLSKYPRVYKKITKNYAKDSLLKLFIDVHIRVCKLLLKMANTPASRGQQIRWLRQALPMYFEP